jgi:hypothetical protein
MVPAAPVAITAPCLALSLDCSLYAGLFLTLARDAGR